MTIELLQSGSAAVCDALTGLVGSPQEVEVHLTAVQLARVRQAMAPAALADAVRAAQERGDGALLVLGSAVFRLNAEVAKAQRWLERLRLEKQELAARLGRLYVFIGSPEWAALPAAERVRLTEQQQAMQAYLDVLGQRLTAAENSP